MASEVFVNPPLQLVAFEAIWQFERSIGQASLAILEDLRRPLPDAEVDLSPPAIRISPDSPQPETALFQVVARERTLAVTLWRNAVVIECTDYQHFDDFVSLIANVVRALVTGIGPLPLTRVGLRYFDEIHAPDTTLEISTWQPWIASELLTTGTLLSGGRQTDMYAGGVSVTLGEERHLTFRYALTQTPIQKPGPLSLRPRPASPALILDTDGFWLPVEPRRQTTEEIVAIIRDLYEPTHSMFGKVPTEACKDMFRRTPQ